MTDSAPLVGIIGTSLIGNFSNLDLAAVAIAIAAIAILGFTVYFSNPKSSTNRAFLWFAFLTATYGAANYLSYQSPDPWRILWFLRLTIFAAVWHAFSFFNLFYMFPRTDAKAPRWYQYILMPWVVIVSVLTLTPWVFSGLSVVGSSGAVSTAAQGPLVPLFGLTAAGLVLAGLAFMLRRAFGPQSDERLQARMILLGATMTFVLILVFNLILPVAFDNPAYIPYAPIFFLPFIVLTAQAIQRYRLLNTKVVAAEALTFALAAVSLIQLIIADGMGELFISLGTFLLIIIFALMLIRSIVREVQQREQLRDLSEDLSYATERLQELDRMKSRFLSFASHQLKAPMTSVKWTSSLIADGSLGKVPKEVAEAAHEMEHTVDSLVSLVNEFLDLRRLEEGRMEYRFEPTDISAMVGGIVHQLKANAEHKGLALTFASKAKEAWVMADRQKLSQVFTNLIDNSIKYTDAGSITASIALDDKKTVTVTVSDTGHGIDKELLPTLFEEFERDHTDAKRIEGTGLGLYIAKQIVAAHSGRIWVESDGRDKGSRFRVTLPLTDKRA